MSTIKVTNVQNPSAASAAITLDTNGQATLNGLAYPTSGSLSGRNRIINGDMRIDQRNAGASVTPTAGQYTLDRWYCAAPVTSKYSIARSTTAPTGFTNSALITSLSAYTVGASESFNIQQVIEGFNGADLGFGTASASAITLSFWVRSSLTGTFGAAIQNASSNRSYPFSYTISSANTFEYKTVTIPGDTSGTWATDNSGGITVIFSIGTGSTLSGTAGSWSGSNYKSVTGATSVVGTNGATFYITGVQLEAGSVATPFERRSYGQELALCQRYYQKSYSPNVVPGTVTSDGRTYFVLGAGTNTANKGGNIQLKTNMRTSPTVVLYNEATGASGQFAGGATANYLVFSDNAFAAYVASSITTELYAAWTASAEL